jgi:NADH:ubiquinone oxidoreductase subunit K
MGFSILFFLLFATIIFIIGIVGLIFTRKNYLLYLISLEVLFLAININFIFATIYIDDIFGNIFVIFILAVSGSEIAIGLAFLILLYRVNDIIIADNILNLKG